jgi:hypothetical protein
MSKPKTKIVTTSISLFGCIVCFPGILSAQSRQTAAGDKDEWFAAQMQADNSTVNNEYGRVIDQNGDPVAGADVQGNVLLETSFVTSGTEVHTTTTDANGLFEFEGLHGLKLESRIVKAGYVSSGRGFRHPKAGQQSTPTDRETFVMWKLQGAEAMVHRQIFTKISSDNSPVEVNLTTGKAVKSNGDMIVRFSRSPAGNVRGAHCDWTLTLEIQGGGLIEIHDPYPYKAPEDGYNETMSIASGPNLRSDSISVVRNFYFKMANGSFGRLTVDLSPNLPSPMGFGIGSYLNPSGSRNLEYDETKDPYAPQLLH